MLFISDARAPPSIAAQPIGAAVIWRAPFDREYDTSFSP